MICVLKCRKFNCIRNIDITVDASILACVVTWKTIWVHGGRYIDKVYIRKECQFKMMKCVLLLRPQLQSEWKGTMMFVTLPISEINSVPAVQGAKLSWCRLFLHILSKISLSADLSWVPGLRNGIVISFLTTSHCIMGENTKERKASDCSEIHQEQGI